jgi:Domain of unknown function (DUF4202)
VISRAERWIAPYWNAEHLRRARDWLLVLDPQASEALQLAALTHDMERHFPGGPVPDLTIPPAEDTGYRMAHSERSAAIVADWLRGEGADGATVAAVERLIVLHETGGDDEADLLQAADSISFLEVNIEIPYRWVEQGLCDDDRARAQHRWMFERIRLPAATALARPLYEQAVAPRG